MLFKQSTEQWNRIEQNTRVLYEKMWWKESKAQPRIHKTHEASENKTKNPFALQLGKVMECNTQQLSAL